MAILKTSLGKKAIQSVFKRVVNRFQVYHQDAGTIESALCKFKITKD